MHLAYLRPYLEGISPYRVVYTMIVSSLKALLLPLFSGVLYLIKKIHYNEGLPTIGWVVTLIRIRFIKDSFKSQDL